MGHARCNRQMGYKNGNRLPDHVQEMEGFLKDHILNCIEDSVKTYLPDSYVTYHELEQEDDWDFEESILKIIDEIEEYQSVNPQETLQLAIDYLRKSVK